MQHNRTVVERVLGWHYDGDATVASRRDEVSETLVFEKRMTFSGVVGLVPALDQHRFSLAAGPHGTARFKEVADVLDWVDLAPDRRFRGDWIR